MAINETGTKHIGTEHRQNRTKEYQNSGPWTETQIFCDRTIQEVGGTEADQGKDRGPGLGGVTGQGDRTGAGYQSGAVRVGNHHGGAAGIANQNNRQMEGRTMEELMVGGTTEEEMTG